MQTEPFGISLSGTCSPRTLAIWPASPTNGRELYSNGSLQDQLPLWRSLAAEWTPSATLSTRIGVSSFRPSNGLNRCAGAQHYLIGLHGTRQGHKCHPVLPDIIETQVKGGLPCACRDG